MRPQKKHSGGSARRRNTGVVSMGPHPPTHDDGEIDTTPSPTIDIAVGIAGSGFNLSEAFVDFVGPRLGIDWAHLDRVPDADIDRLCDIMVRINAAMKHLPLPPFFPNTADLIRRVI